MFFVYYTDDAWELGGVDFEQFETREAAVSFIQDRMAKSDKPNVANYRVIEGKELKVVAKQYATRIELA